MFVVDVMCGIYLDFSSVFTWVRVYSHLF